MSVQMVLHPYSSIVHMLPTDQFCDYLEASTIPHQFLLPKTETLKDYAIKALVNTVDHLGSVKYKVNDLLDEKVVEVSVAELRVSCIGQGIKTWQEYLESLTQQSLAISTPKYYKRCILPVGETKHGANYTKSKYAGCQPHQVQDKKTLHNSIS
ncbi:hypothetical protein VNO77_19271 [Canavalia gladiata]|uniref:Uncharacterized protein n=1 Tax=Canavalia gladiata TaxID=3824 RepID=A0AAN9LQN4_CANGL